MRVIALLLILVSFSFGQFASGTVDLSSGGTGTETIGFEPKGMITILVSNSIRGNGLFSMGFSDFTSGGSIGLSGYELQSGNDPDSEAWSYSKNDVYAINYEYDKTITAQIDFDGTTSTGFKYDVTNTETVWDMGYLAFGGCEVKVGSFSAFTSIGNKVVTGVGFKPDVVLFLVNLFGATINSNQQHASFTFGWMDDTNEASIFSLFVDGNNHSNMFATATSAINEYYHLDYLNKAEYVSMDSDGFTINTTIAAGGDPLIHYMAIKGMETYIDAIMARSTVGTITETGTGFLPEAILGFTAGNRFNTSVEFGFGFATGTSSTTQYTFATSHWHEGDPINTDNMSRSGQFMDFIQYDGARLGYIDVQSFDSDGWTFYQGDGTDENEQVYILGLRIKESNPLIFFGIP